MRRPRACAASKSGLRRKRRSPGRVSRREASRPGITRDTPGLPSQSATASATRLRDEFLAALRTTAGQHLAAVLGGHARAEPMRALTAQLAWLIRTLHGQE